MRIAMVSPSNIFAMPYYFKYEKTLLNITRDDSIDLIYWDRSLIEEKTNERIKGIPFHRKCAYNDQNPLKIFSFYRYYRFVKKKLKHGNYDALVFLGTYSLLTFFLTPFLCKCFKSRYILDIRDYTYERIKWYFNREEKLINLSFATFISSNGYRAFLPDYNYKLVHNIDTETIGAYLEHSNEYSFDNRAAIRISFIGNVRYLEENRQLINALKNDDRFLLQYFGSGAEQIQMIAEEEGATNVKIFGRFSHEDTYKFYLQTDIINNLYGNSGIELTTALSNKLYFSAALNKPILVCSNTYMEKVSVENGFGFVFDYSDKNIADKLYHWYTKEYHPDAGSFLNGVKNDETVFESTLKELCER